MQAHDPPAFSPQPGLLQVTDTLVSRPADLLLAQHRGFEEMSLHAETPRKTVQIGAGPRSVSRRPSSASSIGLADLLLAQRRELCGGREVAIRRNSTKTVQSAPGPDPSAVDPPPFHQIVGGSALLEGMVSPPRQRVGSRCVDSQGPIKALLWPYLGPIETRHK